jgi:DNA-directed RNA polymerase specialized sigma24 family protein
MAPRGRQARGLLDPPAARARRPDHHDGELRDPAAPAGNPHERSERYERLRQGAEALGRLKPQEVRALLLKAEGYSYREICAITGWTYTKV